MTTTAMTIEEMKAAGQRAAAIESAAEELKKARGRLEYFNKHASGDHAKVGWQQSMSWTINFVLWKAPNSYDRDTTIEVKIPMGVVQQQLVYEVDAAKRKLILLGGTP